VEFGRRAGDQALSSMAYEEAVRLFAMVADVLEGDTGVAPAELADLTWRWEMPESGRGISRERVRHSCVPPRSPGDCPTVDGWLRRRSVTGGGSCGPGRVTTSGWCLFCRTHWCCWVARTTGFGFG
jgi:hypothetical protein